MRLKALTLENFRGYKDRTIIPMQPDLTAIVGKNDVGKSSILEALEIFFNNETVKLDKTDLNVDASTQLIRIGCIFDELPQEVIVDETVPTSLRAEYLVNENGDLEIIKSFKCAEKMGKEEIFLRAIHPSAEKFNNLLEQKIDALKSLGRELGAQVSDERKSSLWREAIRAKAPDLQLSIQEIPIGKFDVKAKSIWEKVDSLLPTYALFKSDRKSSDDDPEAKDPMQAAVKQALSDLQLKISEIESEITLKVLDVAQRTLEKLKEMDSTLADELKPRFKEKPKWSFNFSLDSDRGVPLNKRGSGIRRLILLNFFRAEAERRRLESSRTRVIYAIEEPETSLHPNTQILLINALLELAKGNNCQVMLTTHVPSLAGMAPTSSIIFVDMDSAKRIQISYGSEEVNEQAVKTLGILPEKEVAGAKAIILVEGPADVVFLTHASITLKNDRKLSHTLEDKKIVPIMIGSCGNLKHWITQKTAERVGIPYGVYIDSDKVSANAITDNTKRVDDLKSRGIKAYCTQKRETENYINPSVVQRLHSKTVSFADYDDAKLIIKTSIGVKDSEVIEKVWTQMTAAEILSMDQYSKNGSTRNELVDVINDFLSMA